MMTVMASADSSQWLQMLTFNGREVTTMPGAAATVRDNDDKNIKWGDLWNVLLTSFMFVITKFLI
jgi:hypothetical protein